MPLLWRFNHLYSIWKQLLLPLFQQLNVDVNLFLLNTSETVFASIIEYEYPSYKYVVYPRQNAYCANHNVYEVSLLMTHY